MNRFDYVKYDEKAAIDQADLKNAFQAIEQLVEERIKNGRAKSLVMTSLEEAYMWVGKAVRDDQLARSVGGTAELDEERSAS